jgi:hypothetical protein
VFWQPRKRLSCVFLDVLAKAIQSPTDRNFRNVLDIIGETAQMGEQFENRASRLEIGAKLRDYATFK